MVTLEMAYDPRRVGGSGINVYESKHLDFAVGYNLQITRNWREKGLANRDTGVIRSIDKHGNVRLKLTNSNRTVRFNLNSWRHLDYSYAITTYSVQSNTYANTFLQVNTAESNYMIDKIFLYVGASRASHRLEIFCDNQEQLERSFSRAVLKSKALAPEEIAPGARQSTEKESHEYGVAV